MIPLSLQAIAHAVKGKLLAAPLDHAPIKEVSTNSKLIPPGALFIAIHGDNFDAHNFLPEVAASGAAAALIHRPDAAPPNLPCILVDDTRKALGHLGAFVRSQIPARVIAIGGSNGKTTTKHLVGSVLASAFSGSQSPKSFNNDLGVPLTLLGVAPHDHYVILELGTNHPGELSPLSRIANPHIAAITSIGPEHLEGFGDIDGVRREELCLLDHLASNALVIVNADDPPLPSLAAPRAPRLLTFGFAPDAQLRITSVDCDLTRIRFTIAGNPTPFSLPLPGRHNAANALVAIAVGREMGLSDIHIRSALADCSRPEMRMQILHIGPYTILNDAYNANPASMAAALQTLAHANVPHRRIAVLGEMRELGPSSPVLHAQLGHAAASAGLDALIAVGDQARHLAHAAVVAGMPAPTVHWVATALDAASLLPSLLQSQDTILLKASRSLKLETIANALAANAHLPQTAGHS